MGAFPLYVHDNIVSCRFQAFFGSATAILSYPLYLLTFADYHLKPIEHTLTAHLSPMYPVHIRYTQAIVKALSEFCEQGVVLNPSSALLQSIRNM